MAKKKQKKKKKAAEQVQRPKDFLDMIAPAAVKFNTDHFILGSRYHTAMTLKSYPPMTDELALLRGLGDMGGVNLRLTARQVTPAEEDAILHAATNKSRMERSNTHQCRNLRGGCRAARRGRSSPHLRRLPCGRERAGVVLQDLPR